AHVVRGAVLADVPGLVRAVPVEASRGGSADAASAGAGPIPGKATAVRPRSVLPVSLHDARRAARDRRVVAPRAVGVLRACGEAARLTSKAPSPCVSSGARRGLPRPRGSPKLVGAPTAAGLRVNAQRKSYRSAAIGVSGL